MDMEVMTSSPVQDFNFDSASCTSPYMSAATSPQRFGNFFYSAPTSPTSVSGYYHGGSAAVSGRSSFSSVPFNWKEKPGIPKSHFCATTTSSVYGDAEQDLEEIDFEFDFSGHLDTSSLPADELFDGGRIKPLKPPPKFMYDQNKPVESPKSPKSPKKLIKDAFSPRKMDNFDPFVSAIKQTQKQSTEESSNENRGRERNTNTSGSLRNKSARSLSPFRVSDLLFDPDHTKNASLSSSDSNNSSVWYKKWRIKDLLLFRSASEGRETDSDQMKKYNLLKKTHQEEVKNSSFRSTDSGGSTSKRRSRAQVSAHELHYKINRAASEEMKKRTSLPYRHGLLGCLGFHPTVPEMSNKGVGSAGSSMSRG